MDFGSKMAGLAMQVLMVDSDAVSSSPSAQAMFERAMNLQLAERPRAAIRVLTEALEIDPGFTPARLELARALLGTGRIDEAIALYRELLCDVPARADIRNEFAEELWRRGRREEAAEEFRRSLAVNPEQADPYVGLILSSAVAGATAEVIDGCRRALSFDPSHYQARWLLSVSLLKRARSGDGESLQELERYRGQWGLPHDRVTMDRLLKSETADASMTVELARQLDHSERARAYVQWLRRQHESSEPSVPR